MLQTKSKPASKLQFLTASKRPADAIAKVAYDGQPAHMRMYKTGYERFFNAMPKLKPDMPFLSQHVEFTKEVMSTLADVIREESWPLENLPGENEFDRTILAIAEPKLLPDGDILGGNEIIIARWGNGFTSPVHGHLPGMEFEELISGKLIVNNYRIVDPARKIVRPISSVLYTKGNIVSKYIAPEVGAMEARKSLVHNFTSVGPSVSLHYLSEHSKDGNGNRFNVEYFDDVFPITSENVIKITSQQGMYLQNGDVVLVRSSNVKYFGDHYIVITGRPIMKDHGLRPQDVTIITRQNNPLLNSYMPCDLKPGEEHLILLKLDETTKRKFYDFHGISIQPDGSVSFPEA